MPSATDGKSNVTSYTYDSLDRLSSKTNNDGTVNYTYTADGKISTVTDSTGTTMFTYDLMDGRPYEKKSVKIERTVVK